MHKLNFTEDILAILIGAGLLVLAAVAWILLPYASAAAELALATASADPAFDPTATEATVTVQVMLTYAFETAA